MKTPNPSIAFLALLAALLPTALATPLWAQTQDQSDDVSPYPPDSFRAPVKEHFLELRAGEPAYHALLDLEGIELPTLTLSNPSSEQALDLQVTATGGDGHRRNLLLELEAGGSLTVSLESSPAFDELLVIARGRFTGELADAHGKLVQPLAVAGSEVVPEGGTAEKSSGHVCTGDWTLSCYYPTTCDYISPAIPGDVYCYDFVCDVYWNAQYPTGQNYVTSNGLCWVIWKPDPFNPGCPKSARNCYGERYMVSGASSIP